MRWTMVECWIPPQKLMTKRERMKLGNFSGIPVMMRRMTEENITMCWKRKFRLNRRNVSPSSPCFSFFRASFARRDASLLSEAVRSLRSRSISSRTRRRIFSRSASASSGDSPETCSFTAASISLPMASLVASFRSSSDIIVAPRSFVICAFRSVLPGSPLPTQAPRSSVHVEEDVRDEGEHGADGEPLEERRRPVDDPRLLVLRVHVDLPHREVGVGARVALPARRGHVLRVHHGEWVVRRPDVVHPVAGGAIRHRAGAELARPTPERVLLGGHLLRLDAEL